jgi:hypothetical protein
MASSVDPGVGGGCVLKITDEGAVTLVNYLARTSVSGTYSTQTHLFQTGASGGLPMPIWAVDPGANNALWNLPTMSAGTPATFIVGNAVWHYTGTNGSGTALYQGYYTGQTLALAATGSDGLQIVTLTDPAQNGGSPVTGTFNSVRGDVRLRNGSVAYAGNSNGTPLDPVLNTSSLQTIQADLDITGNIVSFGALQVDTAVAGVTLQFVDDGTTATLHTALGRPQAQWVWSRAASNGTFTALPAMKLDMTNGLTLYDQTLASGSPPSVTISPKSNGVSSISGVLRVRPGGDIPMGAYNAVPPNMTAP